MSDGMNMDVDNDDEVPLPGHATKVKPVRKSKEGSRKHSVTLL